ncbi:hypothetical protein MSNKSG1_00768 [Marinobacter santoriniensis NKSG1]|uniref:Uncharacterized protein n=1 Tax=Marinobacter santoriniensis NKSG1 TaxID=1288826 RepID=M7CXY3_9GAMM|nr:hypothetical protein [Marinobacter santoriniensis]EMP57110.1 hypothetical protein MSNKSG1_00768 [Marinobacter santoriniensis NKSG1]
MLHDLDIENLTEKQMRSVLNKMKEHAIVRDSAKALASASASAQREILRPYDQVDIPQADTKTKCSYARDLKRAQDLTDYNEYLSLYRNPYLTRYFPPISRIGKIDGHRVDSALEVRVMTGESPLAKLKLYTQRHEVRYTKQCRYVSDGLLPGTRIAVEIKGFLRDSEEARKYKEVCEQNDLAILFIFSSRNLECSFATPRKDGSRYTHEEWAERQIKQGLNIAYTFEGEMPDFFRSAKFKNFYRRIQ